MKSPQIKTIRGYSLIEMIVVIAILSIIMPTVFSIIYIIISQQVRIFRVSETKRQGDKIAQFVKDTLLREATGIYKKNGTKRCTSPAPVAESSADGSDFLFSQTYLGPSPSFNFILQNGTLNYVTSAGVNGPIHSSLVTVSNVTFQCIRKNSVTNPIVGISFVVSFIDKTPTPQEGTVSFPYLVKVKLRR